jgi:drug/metabolite transporter (DMT)-like permease
LLKVWFPTFVGMTIERKPYMSIRHLFYFISLGLFWGLSPSFYKLWSIDGVPLTHIIVLTGIGVGIILAIIARAKNGSYGLGRDVQIYGFGCAVLMNMPFGLTIYLANYVQPTELALAISTSPLVNYAIALVSGREPAEPRRLMAILLGLVSSAMLIISRQDTIEGQLSWWLLMAFSLPFLYAAYNWFTAAYWPKDAAILSLGASESFWSGFVLVPFLFWFAPPWSPALPHLGAYWSIIAVIAMWVVERIAYFTLIKEKGAVYTVQAVYLSTPAAVIFAALFFGGGTDVWLWVSLAVLMLALYFNNSQAAATPQSA